MDNSTLGFFAVLIALFIVIKYFTAAPSTASASSKSKLNGTPSSSSNANLSSASATSTTNHDPRPVTKDMVEIVQQIGPNLTDEQVVFDLQQTGSIEATIDKFLQNGDLPQPPMTQLAKREKEKNKKERAKGWGQTKEERSSLLESKRQEMILRARMRLKAQLTNEFDL